MGYARAVKDVFIVAAKRTPFGAFGGKLMTFSATDLQEMAGRAALEASKINPEIIDVVNVGYVQHANRDATYLSRHVSIRLGIPLSSPSLNINRLCGSGFQSLVTACQEITCGDAQVVLTGGTENMSAVPYALPGARFGVRLGMDLTVEDWLWQAGIDQQIKAPLAITAENLAEKYNISREEADRYALQSQQRWKAAQDAGLFKEEMVPVTIKTKKGEQTFDCDEHPRPQTTMEVLAKLPAVFKKGGTVTAGNASGVCDGAGCVIVATEEACKTHNLTPLARVAGYAVAGCDPHIMGIGPVPAIRSMLKATGKTLQDIDLVEVNEAFASQYLAVHKELDLDPAKTNRNGGAIALGHPAGASGSRITAHLTYELRRTGGKYAVGSACIGGGQGIAILLENTN